ncbi:MAG: ion transporter [Chromatiales bacterium]|nr:ion transporter [Chromatiales bacterium]
MTATTAVRQRVRNWVESRPVQLFIMGVIVLNAITLGMETSSTLMARWGDLLYVLDHIALTIFVVEIGLKLFALGGRYFRDPWNVFDFVVVGIALVPASGAFAVLRALRVLRVLRLVSVVPQLRFVVQSLLHAIPGVGAIAGLMVLVFYVFAVMATGLFGGTHPDWFGDIGRSMYTLFQVMTLESWSMGIARPVMESHPYAWLFFVPFILIATFTVLNLFIAIIVNTMQTMQEKVSAREQAAIEQSVHAEGTQLEADIRSLREELADLRRLLVERQRRD